MTRIIDGKDYNENDGKAEDDKESKSKPKNVIDETVNLKPSSFSSII